MHSAHAVIRTSCCVPACTGSMGVGVDATTIVGFWMCFVLVGAHKGGADAEHPQRPTLGGIYEYQVMVSVPWPIHIGMQY